MANRQYFTNDQAWRDPGLIFEIACKAVTKSVEILRSFSNVVFKVQIC
jgi:hypothetical protein